MREGGCLLIVTTKAVPDRPSWLEMVLGKDASIQPTSQEGAHALWRRQLVELFAPKHENGREEDQAITNDTKKDEFHE